MLLFTTVKQTIALRASEPYTGRKPNPFFSPSSSRCLLLLITHDTVIYNPKALGKMYSIYLMFECFRFDLCEFFQNHDFFLDTGWKKEDGFEVAVMFTRGFQKRYRSVFVCIISCNTPDAVPFTVWTIPTITNTVLPLNVIPVFY
ncbi:hypothetical protein CHARACLAT_013981 [Characodon lateralis]|uniref:Uncharacterized protein n=1 Tax=Characodon lateralis TaxID=208331 RepID=A0ABU7F2T8_9TELE|nr:hypothetical protein [Characodon lateralis]